MKREDKIKKLIEQCKQLSMLNDISKAKTEDYQHMARLARAGEKCSNEFKALERKYTHPTVIDYGDVIGQIVKTVKGL